MYVEKNNPFIAKSEIQMLVWLLVMGDPTREKDSYGMSFLGLKELAASTSVLDVSATNTCLFITQEKKKELYLLG